MKKLFLLTVFCMLAACQGRDTVVNPHEQRQQGTGETPSLNQKNLQFGDLNLANLQQAFTESKRNSEALLTRVILPLEQNVFNLRTLLNPETTSGNFYQWINLYTESLYELVSFHSSKAADAKLDAFIALAMHECNLNLDNCQLLSVFRLSPSSSRLFVLKANKVGATINECVSNPARHNCSTLVTQKYKFLAFANLLDIAGTKDKEFLSSYLEHANLLLEMNSTTQIHQLSVAMFMTLFQTLEASPEQCEIAKKFNSWSYSKKHSTRYEEISKKLFSLATSCDLYQANGQLSASFWNTMKEQQISNNDPNNISFYHRLLAIKRTPVDMEAAKNLGLVPLLTKATTRTTKGALNPRFYNEYFYALDRFYNGHIVLEDAQQILLGATRDYTLLLESFSDYMKLRTFLKMTDSKKFLKNIIDRNQAIISSERLFERSILDSEPLAQEWITLQSGFNNLFIAVKFVLSRQNSASLSAGLRDAELQFKNLAQSLKIMVTYPAMHQLAHLISESQGTVSVRTFWGKIEKSAMTIYQELWAGLLQPWFRFADDPTSINKYYLLYSLDYNVKSNFVLIQKDADSHDNNYLRGHFFSVLLNKFIGKIRSELEKKYRDDFRSKRTANPMVVSNQNFCAFELDPAVTSTPPLNMPVESLTDLIYSGQSKKTSSNYLQPTLELIDAMKNILSHIHVSVKPRIEYAHQLLYVAEANGITGDILKEAKNELQRAETVMNDAIRFFAAEFKNQKNCFIRMTLAEQFQQYLVIENERTYLARVHSEMAGSLQNKEGPELLTAIQSLNNVTGRYKDTNQVLSDSPEQNYFDFFSSRSAFNYSQYDFLMRLAQRLESGTLETPSGALLAHEQRLREKFPAALRKPLLLNRNWSIRYPPNVKDSVFLKDRSADIPLVWSEDREEFIRQGLSALNKANKPFTTWFVENNKIDNFKSLVESAMYLYAATGSTSPKQITSNDVFRTMEDLVHFISLTDYDVQIFKDLGLNSKASPEEMANAFLATAAKVGSDKPEILSESLHPFTFFYDNFVKVFNVNNSIFRESLLNANMLADQPLENAYLFATVLNNDVFKINFQTHDHLVKKLKEDYTQITKKQMEKIVEIRKILFEKKDAKYAEAVFRILDNQEVSFESASAVSHSNNLIHPQKYNNILIFIREFDQSTRNAYGTGELLKNLPAN
jgi:hypothetical protein